MTIENVDIDGSDALDAFLNAVIADGMVKVREESGILRAQGLIGPDGEYCGTELPADMHEGSGCDCGLGYCG